MTVAKHVHVVSFKSNDTLAIQDQIQERPLFLLQGDVYLLRRAKDIHEKEMIKEKEKGKERKSS